MVRVPLCDISWRTLDAQYWGVPQRRRRIFLVSDFAAEGRCAAEVLFVEPGMSWALEKSGAPGEEVAAVAGDSAQASSWCIAGNVINRKDKNGGHHLGVDKNVSYKSPRNFVEYPKEVPLYDISHRNDGVREIPKGACNTLTARMGTGGGNVPILNEADRQETDDVRTVRRLTPTECERLQGLPDDWTNIEFNGKPSSDSRRYKAIGNGMAQPCADFVIAGIVRVVEEKK